MIADLSSYLDLLRKEGDLREISAPVDPHLEAAEIHRRVIAESGPALLFRSIKGSPFPLATNLFGTERRIELAFGPRPERLIRQAAELPHTMMPPTLGRVWKQRSLFMDLARTGFKRRSSVPVAEVIEDPPRLDALPLLTTWERDGGPFVTLPLVYTEHPATRVHNLGIYRLQRFDSATTGFHCQIGKGAGYHLAAAAEIGERLPVNVSIGGPPALILSAIAPLPENVPELLLASLVMGGKVPLGRNPRGPLPLIGSAEFTLIGEVDPAERRVEGPFGDHYGYYSLEHDFPVFRCRAVVRRSNPICTATVVGKPKQEDFFLGDYLQKLLSPLFPVVMPTVVDLWSYGETGYHSLAAAVVRERFRREALVSGFRILGEGQLALTKFLLLTDQRIDLKDFKAVLECVLERADFACDLFVFSNTSMDTLDYTGPRLNEGSKGLLVGVGDPIRHLPREFRGELPGGVSEAAVFAAGCLVVGGDGSSFDWELPRRVAEHAAFAEWPLVVIADHPNRAAATSSEFLWSTFTRFEPARDIYSRTARVHRNHVVYESPIVIDARLKPGFPDELECDERTKALVDRRWGEYFPDGL